MGVRDGTNGVPPQFRGHSEQACPAAQPPPRAVFARRCRSLANGARADDDQSMEATSVGGDRIIKRWDRCPGWDLLLDRADELVRRDTSQAGHNHWVQARSKNARIDFDASLQERTAYLARLQTLVLDRIERLVVRRACTGQRLRGDPGAAPGRRHRRARRRPTSRRWSIRRRDSRGHSPNRPQQRLVREVAERDLQSLSRWSPLSATQPTWPNGAPREGNGDSPESTATSRARRTLLI